jgi:hypothetical protein
VAEIKAETEMNSALPYGVKLKQLAVWKLSGARHDVTAITLYSSCYAAIK